MTNPTRPPRTLLDTNILFPAGMRDILLYLGDEELINPRWSADIGHELKRTFHRNRPDIAHEWVDNLWNDMNLFFPDALVSGYAGLVANLALPDPDDRHVLAAAIHGQCEVIITANLGDFPANVLDLHGIAVEHPDRFLRRLLEAQPAPFCRAVPEARTKLVKPPYSVEEYLAKRELDGLTNTVNLLRQYASLLD